MNDDYGKGVSRQGEESGEIFSKTLPRSGLLEPSSFSLTGFSPLMNGLIFYRNS